MANIPCGNQTWSAENSSVRPMISQLETLFFIKDVPCFPMISPYFIVDFPWSCYVFANQGAACALQSVAEYPRRSRGSGRCGWMSCVVGSPCGYCKQQKDVEKPWENPMHYARDLQIVDFPHRTKLGNGIVLSCIACPTLFMSTYHVQGHLSNIVDVG